MRNIKTVFVLILIFSSFSFGQNYSIEYKSIKKKNKAKNYEITISYTQIKGLNNASEKGYNKLLESIAKGQADTFKVWMQEWESPPGFEHGSFYELGDTVLYNDSKIVSSLFYEFYYFSGAAHPNNSSFSINYDLEKNTEMKLSDLFTGEYLKKLSEICIEEVAKAKQEYAPDYNVKDDDWLNSGAGPDEKNFKVFNITKDKFIITFPTYQVASYAEGPQTVEIPYSLLKDIVNQDGPLKKFLK
jgi:hypothetical protein